MDDQKISMFQAGVIFSVSLFLFLLFSFLNPFENFYIAGTVGELLPILMPSVAGLLIFKKSLPVNLKFNRLRLGDGILVMTAAAFFMPFSMAVNALNMWLVKVVFGKNVSVEIPVPQNGGELLISIAVIGVVAAICEEILFRGVLQGSLEKLGKAGMFMLVSLLFAAFHFNIEQFMGLFVISLLISYVVYRTNSIFAGMIAHFTNNSIAVLISYLAARMPEQMIGQSQAEGLATWLEIAVIGVVVALFSSVAAVLLYILHRRTAGTRTDLPPAMQLRSRDIVSFLPGAILMALMFLITISAYIFIPAAGF
ncbi:MAG: CPBP family intramembrane metalloprotease [Clostridia bacterium]|nr:CPBP family intramembrane metalloprotease [Clostridia bacterium]